MKLRCNSDPCARGLTSVVDVISSPPEGERTKVRGRTFENPPHPNLLPPRGRRDNAGLAGAQAGAVIRTLNTCGLTFLEMLVVLVVISFLLGIFIIRTRGFTDQYGIETARGDLRSLQTAINAYYLNNNNTYPSGSDWQTSDLVKDSPRVLRQILYDPFQPADTEYGYHTSPNGKYYVVFSYGPDLAADITGINNSGQLTSTSDDDIFLTNGTGTSASV